MKYEQHSSQKKDMCDSQVSQPFPEGLYECWMLENLGAQGTWS